MQGLESLNEFKSFVSKIGGLGRYEDTYMVHAAEGETVVPMEVLDRNPLLKKRLFKTMMDMGIEPGRYIVGNDLNSKNPVTGQPEFFLKKIVSQIRKAMPGDSEKYLGALVGMATGNPLLGALAGGVGSGVEGAIGGGLLGYRSPGIAGLGGGFGRDFLSGGLGNKAGAVSLGNLFGQGTAKGAAGDAWKQLFLGTGGEGGDKSGILGKGGRFLGIGGDKTESKSFDDIYAEIERTTPGKSESYYLASTKNKLDQVKAARKGMLGGMTLSEAATMYGLGTIGIGALIQMTSEDKDVGVKRDPYETHGLSYENILNPKLTYGQPSVVMAEGGVLDLQDGGESKGPGTGTSDSIPAMLSDGEFVMTADAVRGAGGGDRREGAKKMYEAMDRLEARA